MNELRNRSNANLGFGVILVVLGFLFLIGQVVGGRFWENAWPFVIIVPGLMFFVGMVAGGKSAGGLAIPGSIITTIGLLMLYQNTFNRFESWAYAWALIPTAVGVGIYINGLWSEQADLLKKGKETMRVGLIMLLIGFVFFEFVLRIGGMGRWMAGGMVGPLVLVLLGGYLLYRGLSQPRRQQSNYELQPPASTVASSQPSHPIAPVPTTPTVVSSTNEGNLRTTGAKMQPVSPTPVAPPPDWLVTAPSNSRPPVAQTTNGHVKEAATD